MCYIIPPPPPKRRTQAPKNTLQQCLNSHVIGAYLDSRASRKQAADDGTADKENCLETIQRGRDALLNFQAIRARSKASTKLKVVPTPRIALGTIPVINTAPISAPVDQPRQYGENYTGRGRDGADYASSVAGFLPAAAASDVVDLTWTTTPSPSPPMASRTNRGYQNSEAGLQARPAVQQTSYTGMDDDVDSLFDDVDVDALVANHQRAQQQKRRGAPQMSPISEQSFISPPSTQTSGSQETASATMAEDLRQSIKQTRENLRKVREECDDAFLEGDVPDFMQKRRAELEQELEELSRRPHLGLCRYLKPIMVEAIPPTKIRPVLVECQPWKPEYSTEQTLTDFIIDAAHAGFILGWTPNQLLLATEEFT
ncbi:hypothetical protein PC117_g21978 [Phytophthora cactorum]|uniref:Uncharacterized protein n=1 Tax=Phytophthora cactorum TaxID=29920 RepID=A0A8T1BFA7_9STRA|nr:hypothetical protein PC117_g21978 [Phytophthora cactorum]